MADNEGYTFSKTAIEKVVKAVKDYNAEPKGLSGIGSNPTRRLNETEVVKLKTFLSRGTPTEFATAKCYRVTIEDDELVADTSVEFDVYERGKIEEGKRIKANSFIDIKWFRDRWFFDDCGCADKEND